MHYPDTRAINERGASPVRVDGNAAQEQVEKLAKVIELGSLSNPIRASLVQPPCDRLDSVGARAVPLGRPEKLPRYRCLIQHAQVNREWYEMPARQR